MASIHAAGKQSGCRMVLVATGAGGHAIATLLSVAGAGSAILEATIPYAQEALENYIGRRPEAFVHTETAVAMAKAALERGRDICSARGPGLTPIGVGITATIATDSKTSIDRCIVATARPAASPDTGKSPAAVQRCQYRRTPVLQSSRQRAASRAPREQREQRRGGGGGAEKNAQNVDCNRCAGETVGAIGGFGSYLTVSTHELTLAKDGHRERSEQDGLVVSSSAPPLSTADWSCPTCRGRRWRACFVIL